MEVTAFIIELSAEVVKGMQGGNEYWMMNNEKLRAVRLWKGWCGVKRWCNNSSIVDSALH